MKLYTFKRDNFLNMVRVIKINNKYLIDYIKYRGRYKREDVYLELKSHFEVNQIICDCFL